MLLRLLQVVRWNGDPADVIAQINALGYGLTCGIQTRIDSRAQALAPAAHVGNIYINRNMIGAVVGVQPFGGEGLSGTGPKAWPALPVPLLCGADDNCEHHCGWGECGAAGQRALKWAGVAQPAPSPTMQRNVTRATLQTSQQLPTSCTGWSAQCRYAVIELTFDPQTPDSWLAKGYASLDDFNKRQSASGESK